ncbi:hypothetical protein ACO0LB_17985 [Undibacterium sp. SXout7W]|uniref:hypothetical protein n=1 Tax=Undibacterium sp. SXout7W TaxID=3413049 RepID=UPI003BF3C94C
MSLLINRINGTVVEIHDGAMRVKAQIQLFGYADVVDPQTKFTFQVEQHSDGSFAESKPSTTPRATAVMHDAAKIYPSGSIPNNENYAEIIISAAEYTFLKSP